MKDKHTPGPWNEQSFGPWVYDDKLASVLTEDRSGTVAHLLPRFSEMLDGAVDKELLDAVGTLIAAAPEMYDVLKSIYPMIGQKGRAIIDKIEGDE